MTINHDANGKFAPGNQASPGRPRKAVEAAYLAEILEIVTLEEWRKIIKKTLADAKKGNGYARQFLAEYIVGKPPQILDLRAGDAALIRDVIEALEANGLDMREVFTRMKDRLSRENNADGH